jgi:hypothetical protein
VGLLLFSTSPIHAQESPAFEAILDVSPDGKFALSMSCSTEPADFNNIDPNLITAAESFHAVKNRQASNNLKEKHPSNE